MAFCHVSECVHGDLLTCRQQAAASTSVCGFQGCQSRVCLIAVSLHTTGWRSKNAYANICKYVDSLRLFAASLPTSVVAELGGHYIAVLFPLQSFW